MNTEAFRRIIDAFSAKLGEKPLGDCPICGTKSWQLQDQFAVFSVSERPDQVTLGGRVLPSLVIICSNCGNTMFLNLKILGLEDLLSSPEGTNEPSSAD